ncbi:hypothetical protein EDC04DRAFT_2873164 [Pisolithus marmoratus]|nr:hypothetical protein EDC04DRAFT_2873164 [Pisolithus marmoratus]
MERTEGQEHKSQWAPFCNDSKRDLSQFLMKNVSQTKIDEFLKLLLVHDSGVSFASVHAFLKHVDSLQTGPAWTCEMIDVAGNVVGEDGRMRWEQLELWHRDPVKCIMELIGNLAFRDAVAYVPEHAYADSKGKNRIYDEMWTADWWWDVQGKLPTSATIAPVILSSDKTSLSVFSGNKKAWLVYLTIGNISKDVRRQVLSHVTILIGYLPVSKLKCFKKKTHSLAGYCLFHHAMLLLLQPLVDASHNGKIMTCTDAYVANFPEQCLVACNKERDHEECTWQSMTDTLKTLKCLCAVYEPFWKDLPFTNIFTCITPDILHQLHKGIFHDHLLQWCINIVREKEVDAHFQAMNHYPGLCHFAKGILTVSQWTGTEHKEMQRVFVGLLSGAVDDHVLMVVCSLLDFIYYVQCQQHTDLSLRAMEESLKTFHDHKQVLIDLKIHEDFNMPKIHSLLHYISADGYNTEYPECLHIDYTKDAYRASNKCNYVEQMALWLQRQEAIHHKSAYLAWRQLKRQLATMDQIHSEYKAPDFIVTLKQFLASLSSQNQAVQPTDSDHFDVFHSISIAIAPSTITGHDKGMQRVQATPRINAHGHKPEIPAHFDTVFVSEAGHECTKDVVKPNMTGIPGVWVAQLCIVFKLPEYLGNHPHLLIFVEWFTTLHRCDPVSGLYIINHSTHHHCPNMSIISANCIIWLCHLQAQCGKHISANWSSYNVLEMGAQFYVNSYIDLDSFVTLEQ